MLNLKFSSDFDGFFMLLKKKHGELKLFQKLKL